MSPLIGKWARKSWQGRSIEGQIMDVDRSKYGFKLLLLLEDSTLLMIDTDYVTITPNKPSVDGPFR